MKKLFKNFVSGENFLNRKGHMPVAHLETDMGGGNSSLGL